MPKPGSKPDWMPGTGAPDVVEPSGGKKTAGWAPNEKPPAEFWNWLLQNIDEWIDYLEEVTDATAGLVDLYDAFVGTGGLATHATIGAAVADAGFPVGGRILVLDDLTVNAVSQITKANVEVHFKPGVTMTKGAHGIAIQVSASGCKIHGGRFAGFSGGGDRCILIDIGSSYTQVWDMRFGSGIVAGTNDIEDNNGSGNTWGNINE